MVLVLIENHKFSCKIIDYLDSANISYTTDLEDEYEYILLAEITKRTMEIANAGIKNKKKIILITYLEEPKIVAYYGNKTLKGNKYNEKLYNILKKCHLIIVSLPYFKYILSKKLKNTIRVIERENEIYNNKLRKKAKNNVLIIDFDYENLQHIFSMVWKYEKINFTLIGFKPHYLLTRKNKLLFANIPKNLKFIRHIDILKISDILNNNNYVIYYHDKFVNYSYLINIIFNKKQVIIKNSPVYEHYFVCSKNTYLFNDNEDLDKRFNKMLEGRIANLSEEAYSLIKSNSYNEIVKKFKQML